jgi:UDP-2,4-diacetamido-2,4,6-trideoxy-beta-L-altropyranose hydrolase
MIRSEFSNMPPRVLREKVEEIMITTGGADTYNLTGRLLDILLTKVEYRHIRFNVLVGSAFTNCEYLEELSKNFPNLNLYANSNLPYKLPRITISDVSSIMLRSDLAISAGGSTLYEFAACGTPVMAFILADNQEGLVQKMDELGYILNLGWHHQLKEELVLSELREMMDDYPLRKEMSLKGQKLIDGKGTERIVERIVQNLKNN